MVQIPAEQMRVICGQDGDLPFVELLGGLAVDVHPQSAALDEVEEDEPVDRTAQRTAVRGLKLGAKTPRPGEVCAQEDAGRQMNRSDELR